MTSPNMTVVERQTRMFILRAHAWKAIVAGWLMFWTGTLAVFEVYVGPWSRLVLGSIAFIAGCLLAYGLNRDRRGTKAELVGIYAVAIWDILMLIGLVWGFLLSPQGLHIYAPNESIPLTQPRLYPAAIFGGLTVMLWFGHARAAWEYRRAHKSAHP